MLRLLQFDISFMLFMLCCRNHTHFHEQITIRKQFQHLVCPRNHSQVVMRERPVGKVHVPTTILFLVELDTILPFPAQHAPHHHRCPATYFLYCVHIDCKGTKLFSNGDICFVTRPAKSRFYSQVTRFLGNAIFLASPRSPSI